MARANRRRASLYAGVVASAVVSGNCGAQIPAAFERCAKLSDDKARLTCFDQAVAASRPSAPAAQAVAPAATKNPAAAGRPPAAMPPAAPAGSGSDPASSSLSPEQTFGLSQQRVQQLENNGAPAPSGFSGLVAHISGVRQSSYGRDTYTLDNGQVWRQTESEPEFVVRPGDAVTLSKGALGSFWLASSSHLRTRVTRVR
jgi:hypothetical protein